MKNLLLCGASASILSLAISLPACSRGDEEWGTRTQALIGDSLPGITADDFQTARDAFNTVEEIEDGLGPIFNEQGCGNCHTQGAQGGAGVQIERRFGKFIDGRFSDMDEFGGSLRQLFTVGRFIAFDGHRCNVPLEVEPPQADVNNVGRLTTPLFGLGLVDAMPDSFFDGIAAGQPADTRGVANRVPILLPNVDDTAQHVGTTRVGRFGWKGGIPTLSQFAADAYVNEMGITTQHCIDGNSVLTFAIESAPNGSPVPAGCDDLAPPLDLEGIPAFTDEAVGPCTTGQRELQEDVSEFFAFMTFLAPPDRLPLSPAAAAGQPLFTSTGCADCHTATTFVTPAAPPTRVPGNFAFQPFSDFLVHDMGALGDQIGNDGDSLAVTRRMRTAPLWGIHFRTKLLHDGRTGDIGTAILAHDGQGLKARNAFANLAPTDQQNLIEFVRTL